MLDSYSPFENDFYYDITKICDLFGTKYSAPVLRDCLNHFEDEFQNGFVQFRMTNHSKKINFRFEIDTNILTATKFDLTTTLAGGLALPLHLARDIYRTYDIEMLGADFDTEKGLVKQWLSFPASHYDVFSLKQINALPPAVLAIVQHYDVPLSLIGIDYDKISMNIYLSPLAPGYLSVKNIENILNQFGFLEAADRLWIEECQNATGMAMTFNLINTTTPERFCFYVPQTNEFSLIVDPVFTAVIDRLPSRVAKSKRGYFVGYSFSKTKEKNYQKFEWDYSGSLIANYEAKRLNIPKL